MNEQKKDRKGMIQDIVPCGFPSRDFWAVVVSLFLFGSSLVSLHLTTFSLHPLPSLAARVFFPQHSRHHLLVVTVCSLSPSLLILPLFRLLHGLHPLVLRPHAATGVRVPRVPFPAPCQRPVGVLLPPAPLPCRIFLFAFSEADSHQFFFPLIFLVLS